MTQRSLSLFATILGLSLTSTAIAQTYDGSWQALQRMPVPAWFDDGKIGIFIHWGPYSALGIRKGDRGYAERTPKEMYANPYVNNKGSNLNWPDGVGCREKDNLRLLKIVPKWQSCATIGRSFGYLSAEENPSHPARKSIADVIHEMVEVISRNGNFLINRAE